jgi:hypothetical protein
MKRFAEDDQAGHVKRPGVLDISAEEQEIDRVLADSFPASDPPSWTLGVARVRTDDHTPPNAGSKPHRRQPAHK